MRVKFAHQVELGFAARKGSHLKRGRAISLTVETQERMAGNREAGGKISVQSPGNKGCEMKAEKKQVGGSQE